MGFKKLGDNYPPDEVANVVLRGRFGFRRGYKTKLAPPKAPLNTPEGGSVSPEPHTSAQEQVTLLEAYLQQGTLPPES
jgi:hypothetical protein